MTQRVIELEGGRNFRDLGGYAGADGGVVKWGRLFRSGSMAHLTAADFARLNGLGIAVVCDFRSSHERESEPTVWQGGTPTMIARDHEMSGSHIRAALKDPDRSPQTMRQAMRRFYFDIAFDQAPVYRRMFAEMLQGQTPLVFNCSAGKDRTGIAAALILTVLGVSRADILADYALSETLVDYHALTGEAGGSQTATGFSGLRGIPREITSPLLRSDPEYLIWALEDIAQRDGSLDAYLQGRLGVGAAETVALRGALLS